MTNRKESRQYPCSPERTARLHAITTAFYAALEAEEGVASIPDDVWTNYGSTDPEED